MNNLTSFNAVVNNLHAQLTTTGKVLKELILKVKSLEERFNEGGVGEQSIDTSKIEASVIEKVKDTITKIVQDEVSKSNTDTESLNKTIRDIVQDELSKSTQNVVLPSLDKVLSDVLVDDEIVIQEKKAPAKKPRASRAKKSQTATDGDTGSS